MLIIIANELKQGTVKHFYAERSNFLYTSVLVLRRKYEDVQLLLFIRSYCKLRLKTLNILNKYYEKKLTQENNSYKVKT